MIAKVTHGKGFAGANRYFSNPEKVGEVQARNLPTSNYEMNAEVMQVTAMQSDRVEKPVMNISLSWDPSDKVSDRQMFEAGHELMKELGMSDYQYMIYAHTDTEHPHIHMMINRVHPEQEKALYIKDLYKRIDNFNREKELQNHWRFVPGRYTNQQHLQKAGAEKYTEPNIKVRINKSGANKVLFEAKSWEEMHRRLADRGFGIDKLSNGGGQIYRLDDLSSRLKTSAISQQLSMGKMERRLGAFQGRGREGMHLAKSQRKELPKFHQQIIKHAKDYHQAQQFLQGWKKLNTRAGVIKGREYNHRQLSQQLQRQASFLKLDFSNIYRQPDNAYGLFEKLAREKGYSTAYRQLQQPGNFGELRGRKTILGNDNPERTGALKAAQRAVTQSEKVEDLQERITGLEQKMREEAGELQQIQERQSELSPKLETALQQQSRSKEGLNASFNQILEKEGTGGIYKLLDEVTSKGGLSKQTLHTLKKVGKEAAKNHHWDRERGTPSL